MKRKIVLIMAFVMLAGIMIFFVNKQGYPDLYLPMPGEEVPHVTYTLKIDTSDLPEQILVYKFVEPGNPLAGTNKISNIFGIEGEIKEQNVIKGYFVKGENKNLQYYSESGKWDVCLDEAEEGYPTEECTISKEEAIKISKNFLTKYNLLLPEFNTVVASERSQGSKLTGDYKLIGYGVYFYPKVNGLKVYGVSRIIVEVRGEGKVVRVCKYYKEVEPYKIAKLKPVRDALSELTNNKALVNIPSEATSASIEKIELAYWEDAGSIEEQPYLQPVYVFTGTTIIDGKVCTFNAFVPAIEGVSVR